MATLQLRHPALVSAVRGREDIRAALAEDPHLVQHVMALDVFLQALSAEYPSRTVAEGVCARVLPSRQDLAAVRRQREEAMKLPTEFSTEGLNPPPELVRPRETALERGQRLASEREDFIARGANPADLEVPLAPYEEREGIVPPGTMP